MTVNDLMSVKAELDVLGKSLRYLTIAPDQNNDDRCSNRAIWLGVNDGVVFVLARIWRIFYL